MSVGSKIAGAGFQSGMRQATSIMNRMAGGMFFRMRPNYAQNDIVNGGFDADSDWVKGAGWTISSGRANYDGTDAANTLSQATLTIGQKYTLTFDCALTQGKLTVDAGVAIGELTAPGGASFDFTATSATLTFTADVEAAQRFTGSIDNVICRRRVA